MKTNCTSCAVPANQFVGGEPKAQTLQTQLEVLFGILSDINGCVTHTKEALFGPPPCCDKADEARTDSISWQVEMLTTFARSIREDASFVADRVK